MDWISWVGKTVSKKSRKPFKSGEKINTITGIVDHPALHVPCFTFVEDESYVECKRCLLTEEEKCATL